MSSDDIRVAWNMVTQTLSAVHPDDGTYKSVEIGFTGDRYAEATVDVQDRANAPGGRRLVIGPTLAEVVAAFDRCDAGEPPKH